MVFAGVERAARQLRVRKALEAIGLAERAHHRPEQLSGGERQRVAIARAIVMDPQILLADEPTGNLDSVSGAEIVGLLEKMNTRGLTLLVVTHDVGIASHAGHRLRMVDGRMLE
jgi:putative ABC transport system ATP-binding protein